MQRFVGVMVVVVSACSFEHGSLSTGDAPMPGSDTMPDAQPLGPWSAPVDIGISSGEGDDDPSLTDDMLELYFGSRRIPGSPGQGDENIWVVRRATINDAWSVPVEVSELNTSATETTTKVTGDGLKIFFASDRNSANNADIFFSTRASRTDPWKAPVVLSAISTGGGDYAAYAQTGLKHLVMCAGDTTADEALYTSDRPSTLEPWGPPMRITELDEAGISEGDPMEPRAGVMYYDSWRLNADLTYDIYRVERASSSLPWSNLTKVDGINTDGHHDRDPWVSSDERTIYFSSTRDGRDRIYMSTR